MFARVTLQTVGMLKNLNLTLRLLRSRTIHIPLLFQMPDLTTTTHKMNQTLVADKQKHHEKHK